MDFISLGWAWGLNIDSLDNLAVSAQGFRRGANRVRKVRFLYLTFKHLCLIIPTFHRICGTFFFAMSLFPMTHDMLVLGGKT